MSDYSNINNRITDRKVLNSVSVMFIVAVLLSLLMVLTNARQASAAAPYLASDVLGQVNYTDSYPVSTVGADGLSGLGATKVDPVNHLLFLADTYNSRILIYNLDISNELIDNTADFVLGQADFTSNGPNTTVNGLRAPGGLSIDPYNNLLYVADTYNHRVLVFDTSSLANNMDADYVLGQPDYISSGADTNAKGFNNPIGLSIDLTSSHLYVADSKNRRVLVFDTSTLSNNMDADYVLGQPNFTSSGSDTNAKGFAGGVSDLSVDSTNNLLYVADTFNNRVLIFDITTIIDNEDAVNVLGQVDFTSSGFDVTAKGFTYPYGLNIDSSNNLLYVSDSGNDRVLIFDTSTIIDNEDAVNVLGQPDFTSSGSDTNAKGFNNPHGLFIDSSNNRLYVADRNNLRVLIFDTISLVDNEDAINVLGQGSYTSSGNYVEPDSFDNYGNSPTLDSVHHRLFVSDSRKCRILVFNLDLFNNLVDKTADAVIGSSSLSNYECDNTANNFNSQGQVAYDSINDRLFVPDMYDNCRVLVFDTTVITNGEDAVNILGGADLNDYGECDTTQTGLGEDDTYGAAVYDETTEKLYVADMYWNSRIMVYDLSSGISDGMNASHVLGSVDFVSSGVGDLTATGIDDSYPNLIIDSVNQRLFFSSYDQNRIMVFDVASITDGEPAVNILGQPDFTSSGAATTQDGLDGPVGLGYDHVQQLLFVSDYGNSRILIYDVNSIIDGEDAVGVLGQVDFSSGGSGTSQSSIYPNNQATMTYDSVNRRMYFGDDENARVLIFDFANITNTTLLNATNGASYTDTIDYVGTQGTESFAVTAGALPPGITLNPSTGVLSGTATTNGTYNFTVELTDDNGAVGSFKDSQSYVLGVTTDTDGDGVSDDVEQSSPLGNDVNNDAIPDNEQAIVTTSYNSVSNTYTTAVIDNCATGFNYFFSEAEADIATQDEGYTYPLGLQNFQANCSVGATATITQYLDKVYDTSNWTYRKYINNQYIDFSSNITYGTATVNGITVTTVQFSITDGGPFDNDGLADGMITDPLGAAVADGDLANTGVSIQLSIASGIAIILLSAALIPKKNRKYILERL